VGRHTDEWDQLHFWERHAVDMAGGPDAAATQSTAGAATAGAASSARSVPDARALPDGTVPKIDTDSATDWSSAMDGLDRAFVDGGRGHRDAPAQRDSAREGPEPDWDIGTGARETVTIPVGSRPSPTPRHSHSSRPSDASRDSYPVGFSGSSRLWRRRAVATDGRGGDAHGGGRRADREPDPPDGSPPDKVPAEIADPRRRLLRAGTTALVTVGVATLAVAYFANPAKTPGASRPPGYVAPPPVPPADQTPDPGLVDPTTAPPRPATTVPQPEREPEPEKPTRTTDRGTPTIGNVGDAPKPTPVASKNTPATTVVTAPAAGMVVRIASRATGGFVTVQNNSTADGARLVQSMTAGTATQWRLVSDSGCFQFVNTRSGRALDNTDGAFYDGAQMQQWERAVGNPNQIWCAHAVGSGWFSLRNATSGSLLDLRDGSTGNGAAIQQWSADPAAPNANQTWRFLRVT